jgi:hypothetical protein
MTEGTSRFRSLLRSGSVITGGLLIAAGLVGVIGLGAAAAWTHDDPESTAGWRPAAVRTAAGSVANPGDDLGDTLRERAREMARDHMGLSEAEADAWASQMAERMRQMHGDDAQAMMEACEEYRDGAPSGEYGRGMMEQFGPGGMMDGNRGRGGMMDGNRGRGGMMGF